MAVEIWRAASEPFVRKGTNGCAGDESDFDQLVRRGFGLKITFLCRIELSGGAEVVAVPLRVGV